MASSHDLTDHDRIVLEMHVEIWNGYRNLSGDTGISCDELKMHIRELRKQGYVDFGYLCADESNLLAGKGYWLTPLGAARQRELRQKGH